MNICGVLVHAGAKEAAAVEAKLKTMPGVEVHDRAPGDRFIVTVEDVGEVSAADTILEIHRLSGVITATLTFHSFEELDQAV